MGVGYKLFLYPVIKQLTDMGDTCHWVPSHWEAIIKLRLIFHKPQGVSPCPSLYLSARFSGR
jgi:hypothetical protein